MAYDERLVERVRRLLPEGTEERRMFGGLSFMVAGRLACSVTGDGLLVRVGRDGDPKLASLPHVRPMVMGTRVMKGYLYVERAGLGADGDLEAWVRRAVEVVGTLGPRPER